MLVIVDYGMGNLFSIEQACKHVGIDCLISNDPEDIWRASGIILPGVGAFPAAMERLKVLGLVDTLKSYAAAPDGRLVIGICLGMQLMMERSEENGGAEGLHFLSRSCVKLEDERLPRVGFRIIAQTHHWHNTPLHGLDPTHFYFNHSYGVAHDPLYGNSYAVDCDTVALIGNGSNIWGLQFHPEKSGPAGLKVFENIKRMLGDA